MRGDIAQLKKELEFARDSYAPGDTVVADLLAKRRDGAAAAGAKRVLFVANYATAPSGAVQATTTSESICR